MGIRSLARQRALQFLYTLEFRNPKEELQHAERRFLNTDATHMRGWGDFSRNLAIGTFEHQFELDEIIRPALRNWSLERMPVLDKLCLRMAIEEMRSCPEIPLRVTLNEYIDLAKMFGTDESPQYVNAVLDRVARDFKHKDFVAGGAAAGSTAEPEPDETEPLDLTGSIYDEQNEDDEMTLEPDQMPLPSDSPRTPEPESHQS